jgi:single-stranded-DNA-specific exonuclease
MAGVGVMFYVLLALRAELRARGVFDERNQPKLDALLPLVALGTVADVVKLDANNRRLVAQGLKRIRAGAMPCRRGALFAAAGRKARRHHLRLRLRARPAHQRRRPLSDMTLGIECLLTDDPARADELARTLDGINRERRDIEGGMREQAMLLANRCSTKATTPPPPRSASSTRTSTKAWSASSPRGSRTACTGRPSSSRQPGARQGTS